jgi:AraC-like DNA-binding protein
MKNQFTLYHLNEKGYITFKHKPARHPVYVFCFLLEGEVLAEIDGQNILIGPGQFVLVPPDKNIDVKYFNGCKGFDGSFYLEFVKDASYSVLRSNSVIQQSFWFEDAVFMGALFTRLFAAYEDKDKLFLQSGLDLILAQLRPGGKVAAVPEKFLQLVFEKDKAPLSVSEYAEILSVTPNYLNKAVKTRTHRTAIDWIEIARINIAKKLLKDPAISIADIASMVGLPDQSYFSRFFKKKTGQTPSEFRNEL